MSEPNQQSVADLTSYECGYDDGIEDSISTIEKHGGNDVIALVAELRKHQGYVDCPDCNGTGERQNITRADIYKALLVDFGAVADLSRPCETCWGNRVIPAPPEGE